MAYCYYFLDCSIPFLWINYMGFCGKDGRYIPNLFFKATLCELNLSSGEKRAG